MKFYHSTSKDKAEEIIKKGFDLSKGQDMYFGKGVYCFVNKNDCKYWEDETILEITVKGFGFEAGSEDDFQKYITGNNIVGKENEYFINEGYDYLFSKEELNYFNPETLKSEDKECEIAVIYNTKSIKSIEEVN